MLGKINSPAQFCVMIFGLILAIIAISMMRSQSRRRRRLLLHSDSATIDKVQYLTIEELRAALPVDESRMPDNDRISIGSALRALWYLGLRPAVSAAYDSESIPRLTGDNVVVFPGSFRNKSRIAGVGDIEFEAMEPDRVIAIPLDCDIHYSSVVAAVIEGSQFAGEFPQHLLEYWEQEAAQLVPV